MPISMTKSPTDPVVFSRNSCRAPTSPCNRLIRRPTWVLSMNESETSWKCENIARRTSKITRLARRCDSHSPTKNAAENTRPATANPASSQWNRSA